MRAICDLSPTETETVDQINYDGGVFGGAGVLGKCMGVPESVWGPTEVRKHTVIDSEPRNMMGGVHCPLKAQVTDLAISLS